MFFVVLISGRGGVAAESPSEVIIDEANNAVVNLGGEATSSESPKISPTPSPEVALPWGGKDSTKGFVEETEDGSYIYRESKGDDERYYETDEKVVPKKENFDRGLVSVTNDGSYYYKGEDSELTGSASLRFSRMPPLIYARELDTFSLDYETIYGGDPIPLVLLDYDLFRLQGFGHWVLTIGTGVGQKEGPGFFRDTGEKARERYTLYFLLNHVSFVYRFQYSPHPWIVPYIGAGGMPVVLYEKRDDNERNKSAFISASQFMGGLRLNVGNIDSHGSSSMDAEYGINNFWLDVEYRRLQSLGETIDISNNLLNVGVGFDF